MLWFMGQISTAGMLFQKHSVQCQIYFENRWSQCDKILNKMSQKINPVISFSSAFSYNKWSSSFVLLFVTQANFLAMCFVCGFQSWVHLKLNSWHHGTADGIDAIENLPFLKHMCCVSLCNEPICFYFNFAVWIIAFIFSFWVIWDFLIGW